MERFNSLSKVIVKEAGQDGESRTMKLPGTWVFEWWAVTPVARKTPGLFLPYRPCMGSAFYFCKWPHERPLDEFVEQVGNDPKSKLLCAVYVMSIAAQR